MSSPHHREGPKQQAAYRRYLALGEDRSLTNLHAALQQDSSENARIPTLSTLFNWSRWFGWVARAAEYDRKLADDAEEKQRKRFAAEAAKRADRRRSIYDIQLTGAMTALLQEDPKTKTTTIRDFHDVGHNLLRAINETITSASTAERLEFGEVTERREVHGAGEGGAIDIRVRPMLGPEALSPLRDEIQSLVNEIRAAGGGGLTPIEIERMLSSASEAEDADFTERDAS